MALRDAFSRFLRGRAESQRSGGESGDSSSSGTGLDRVADEVDSGDDPDLVAIVETLEGYYDPDTDEFIPTAAAVEIIEGFEEDDDSKDMVRALADSAPASGDSG
jgi:hypothetical protein